MDAGTAGGGILRIALDVPLRRLFDYLPPAHAGGAAPGRRVRVPFGRQRLLGVVLESAPCSEIEPGKLKQAVLLEEPPVLDAAALELLRWSADYYHHPIGEVIAAALPRAIRQGAPLAALETRWRATDAGHAGLGGSELARAPRQRALLGLLAQHPDGLTEEGLDAASPGWRAAARALEQRRFVRRLEQPIAASAAPLPASSVPAAVASTAQAGETESPELSAAQAEAVQRIRASFGQFTPWLLQGVTGSGKTEVYLRLAAEVLGRGQRVLVLVPEIGLTPQLLERFRARLRCPLAVLHSGLSDQERLAAWRAAFGAQAGVVIGTRSAVFAPVPQLGLIVVDEEHDASFKQHDGGFRYSARDLAVRRAQRAGVPIVLGSATPSLETLHNAETHRYQRAWLPYRAREAAPPRLALVDLRAHPARNGLSTPVVQAIERHLAADGQVLVFLNRRGYAPTLLCTACGWVAPCGACDARLTVHQAAQRLRCHHCGADAPLPARCPQCGFALKPVGQGTERIAEALAELFPQAALVRLDRDVVRHREDLQSAITQIRCGAARILIGTQMVTKGHDFPNMTLVAVLNADQGLFSSDFRAPERLAQTIVQVAGRAGRGTRAGEVLIQTEFPDHPLLAHLLAEGYEGFARTALAERAEACWPPFSRLAAVRDSATSAPEALQFLSEARQIAGRPARVKLLGPVPAAMAKRAGRYHAQLLLESPERAALHSFLDAWLPRLEQLPSARRVRWALDVDPLELF